MIQLDNPTAFPLTAMLLFLAIFGRYVLFALGFWWLFRVSMSEQFAHRAVQTRPRKPGQDRREIGWSVVTSLIFTAIGLGIILAFQRGHTRIYLNTEIYPRNFDRYWLGRWLIGATHHGLHHAQFRFNYGLYFTFWDKWMRTESPDYHRLFEEKTGTKPVTKNNSNAERKQVYAA